MILFINKFLISLFLASIVVTSKDELKKEVNDTDLNALSEEFLSAIKNNEQTHKIRAQLYSITLRELQEGLKTDQQKLAFWINIYNGYIQVVLSENPSLYENRGEFFKKEQIPIAGRLISFEKIEHGIIRKSQWPLGLGFIRKWFPDRFERTLRVSKRDYRIHFALNCGAKDCPPVAIYTANRLESQLNMGTKKYLESSSTYDQNHRQVAITPLFNWFRGDFGGKKGIKELLKENNIIPHEKNIAITYTNYDWTLDLDNWITL